MSDAYIDLPRPAMVLLKQAIEKINTAQVDLSPQEKAIVGEVEKQTVMWLGKEEENINLPPGTFFTIQGQRANAHSQFWEVGARREELDNCLRTLKILHEDAIKIDTKFKEVTKDDSFLVEWLDRAIGYLTDVQESDTLRGPDYGGINLDGF